MTPAWQDDILLAELAQFFQHDHRLLEHSNTQRRITPEEARLSRELRILLHVRHGDVNVHHKSGLCAVKRAR